MPRCCYRFLIAVEGECDQPQNFFENLGPLRLAFVRSNGRKFVELRQKKFHVLSDVAIHSPFKIGGLPT